MVITSKDNENIKRIKKLKDKKYRQESKEYIIEGIKFINEAIEESKEIKTVIVCDDCIQSGDIDQKNLYEVAKYDCIYVNENVFKTLSDVQTHQGILAIVKMDELDDFNNKIDFNENLILVLNGISDPGNLGTILRTADSVRFKTINNIRNYCRYIQSKSYKVNNGFNI